jgi:hypothetical protein
MKQSERDCGMEGRDMTPFWTVWLFLYAARLQNVAELTGFMFRGFFCTEIGF